MLSVRTFVVRWDPWSFGSCVLFELLWTDSSFLGESASPFIDEGDGPTRERECVHMLSLVAHAIWYKMIVGAHNIVNVRCMWYVASSSSGMADVGACYTIDAQRHVRGFPIFAWYGKCQRPQHC